MTVRATIVTADPGAELRWTAGLKGSSAASTALPWPR
jgi:hypothetical protein